MSNELKNYLGKRLGAGSPNNGDSNNIPVTGSSVTYEKVETIDTSTTSDTMTIEGKDGGDVIVDKSKIDEMVNIAKENNEATLSSESFSGFMKVEQELDAKLIAAEAEHREYHANEKKRDKMTKKNNPATNNDDRAISSRITSSEMMKNHNIVGESNHPVETMSNTVKRNTNIDLSRVNILSKPDVSVAASTENFLKRIRDRRGSSKAILPMSGFIAKIKGLSSPEIRDYQNDKANASTLPELKAVQFETLYSKIVDTSAGAISYHEFLKSTSFLELEILLYALLCATYPDENKYDGACPKCKHKFGFVYENSKLLELSDSDSAYMNKIYDLMKEDITCDDSVFDSAPTKELKRVILDDIGVIVELRHPTLYDYLIDTIERIEESDNKYSDEAVLNLVFVDRILIPSGDNDYIPVTDIDSKTRVLNELSEREESLISDEIVSITSQYKISFSIGEQQCPKCAAIALPKQPVSVEGLLFLLHDLKKNTQK